MVGGTLARFIVLAVRVVLNQSRIWPALSAARGPVDGGGEARAVASGDDDVGGDFDLAGHAWMVAEWWDWTLRA